MGSGPLWLSSLKQFATNLISVQHNYPLFKKNKHGSRSLTHCSMISKDIHFTIVCLSRNEARVDSVLIRTSAVHVKIMFFLKQKC